jgi:hypothetical protein
MIFVSDNRASKVLKPSKQTLHLPSAPIAPELSAILGFRFFPSFPVRRNHFNTAVIKQLLVKFIAIIGLVANQLIRGILGKTAVYRIFDKPYLVGRSAFNVSGDSKTPFFAGAKLPSMNASVIAIFPRSFTSSTSSGAMRLKTPCLTHCRNRRWHVWYGGYRCGKSFQGAPVRKIHSMPLRIFLGSRAGRPRGSLDGVDDTIMGSIRFHCSFVSSILILLHIYHIVSRFILR